MTKEVGKAGQTVKKHRDGAVLPGQKQTRDRAPSVLTDDVVEYVRDRLAESEAFPGKMRHASERIYDLLVQDTGFEGGRSTVRGAVHRLGAEPGEGFPPVDEGERLRLPFMVLRVLCRANVRVPGPCVTPSPASISPRRATRSPLSFP